MCHADLQEAMQKAMDRTGMKAHVPAPEAHVPLLSHDEQRLLIQENARLEARLQALEKQP